MSSILVAKENVVLIEFELTQSITILGNDQNECDYFIEGLPNLSVIKSKLGTSLRIEKSSLKSSGPFNKNVKTVSNYKVGDFEIIFIPFQLPVDTSIKKTSELKDEKIVFPLDATDLNYPNKLLNYILSNFEIEKGALFYQNQNSVHTLATKNIKIKNKAEFFLLDYINKSEDGIIKFSFDTHTVLFEAGLEPTNFLLYKTKLSKDLTGILYIPEFKNKSGLPINLINSFMQLCSQSIYLHIANKFKSSNDESGFIQGEMFWGNSLKMNSIKKLVDRLADSNLSIILHGETGVGKDVLANYIHLKNKRSNHIVSINCSAIPKDLAESILFGHVKGSFTGAVNDQIGRLIEADGGTLFLDEIGDLDLIVQTKLLRVLQDGIVEPIGGKTKNVNFRLICATHQNLQKLVKQGKFREDLFFRLNESIIELPALRERSEDISVLANNFLEKFCLDNHLGKKLFSPEALLFLSNQKWAGNVRELLSTVRKQAILSENEIIQIEGNLESNKDNSLLSFNNKTNNLNLALAKKQLTSELIKRALISTKGNKTKASELLGITSRSLFRLMAESAEIQDENFSSHDKNVIEDSLNV